MEINFKEFDADSRQPYYNTIFNIGTMPSDLGDLPLPVYDELSARVGFVIEHFLARLASAERARDAARRALNAITKLPVGGCDVFDELRDMSWTNACDRCGEAHDIARAVLEGTQT